MKKDIYLPQVKDVAVAIVSEINELSETEWNVYLLNLKNEMITQVLVSSKGYLKFENGEEIRTTTLRHSLGNIKPNSFTKIEPIMEDVFGLHNEYWVSFFIDNTMYDKKFIFLAETIKQENSIQIPLIEKFGILIN
ncbi:MAG: hypothetical protein IT232_11595 [Flavobacteriales bacterium]|nr:hypothetical protein [Flavobacteriales bacterium]